MSKFLQNIASLWPTKTKKGAEFFASNKITFGDLRNALKEFKEEENVVDSDSIVFFLFHVESENEKAPAFHLKLKKDTFEKKS